jgi:hypothetical protein
MSPRRSIATRTARRRPAEVRGIEGADAVAPRAKDNAQQSSAKIEWWRRGKAERDRLLDEEQRLAGDIALEREVRAEHPEDGQDRACARGHDIEPLALEAMLLTQPAAELHVHAAEAEAEHGERNRDEVAIVAQIKRGKAR